MNQWSGVDWIMHGSLLSEQDPWLAQRIISKGIQIESNKAAAYFNLGIALHMQGRPEAAIRAYRTSLNMPDSPRKEALNNLSLDLLLIGKFQEGWKIYEERLKKEETEFFKYNLGNPWQGLSKLHDLPKKLLLISEGGFGDTLQFCRFALVMQKSGVEVSLFCQNELVDLLQEGSEINNITNRYSKDELGPGTTWCHLLSMPGKLGINEENIPWEKPYIQVKSDRLFKWRKALKRKPNHLLIGLSWQGNPKSEIPLYMKGRSIPFQYFLELNKLKNVEFISLQKGDEKKQIEKHKSMHFVQGQSIFNNSIDFRDTAAIVAQCDLVISSDNGIVHLAGAMGKTTWVLLKWTAEWRWGLNKRHTNWYPNMRLFRQPRANDWGSVIEEIKHELIIKYDLISN